MAGWRTTYGSPLLRRPRPRARRAGRRADPPGRGGADREDQRAGVRGGQPHVQHGLRHHPQPGRPEPQRGRVERGSGLRAGGRDGAAGRGVGHGRVACATRRRSAGSSGCGRAAAGCRRGRRTTSGRRSDRRGPMARNVDDLALLLSVHGRSRPARAAAPSATRARRSRRPSPDAGRAARRGVHRPRRPDRGRRRGRRPRWRRAPPRWPRPAPGSSGAHPDLSLGEDTFRTLRAWSFQAGFRDLLDEHPDGFKAVARRQHPRRRGTHRRRRRPRLPAAHRPRRDSAAVLRAVRRAAAAHLARCRRSRPTRSTPPTSTASRWRRTWTGCGRRT